MSHRTRKHCTSTAEHCPERASARFQRSKSRGCASTPDGAGCRARVLLRPKCWRLKSPENLIDEHGDPTTGGRGKSVAGSGLDSGEVSDESTESAYGFGSGNASEESVEDGTDITEDFLNDTSGVASLLSNSFAVVGSATLTAAISFFSLHVM